MPEQIPVGGGIGTGDILQTTSAVLNIDATTTSVTYVTLLTLNITTFGGTSLEIYLSFSTSNSIDNAATGRDVMRVTLDGTQLAKAGLEQWTVTESGAIFVKSDVLVAGSHTINAEWHTDASGGTLRCSANTLTRPEHCSFMVLEVSN